MAETDEEPDEDGSQRYLLARSEEKAVSSIIEIIRARLNSMSPGDLRAAASTLFGLERLPYIEEQLYVTFGFTFRDGGNLAWADIKFNSEGFQLSTGEHYYEPGVGGDTESRCVFAVDRYGNREGSIESWLEVAEGLADGPISCEDYTDPDKIDWSSADDSVGWP